MAEQGIQTILANAVALLRSDAILGPPLSNCWLPATKLVEALQKRGHKEVQITICGADIVHIHDDYGCEMSYTMWRGYRLNQATDKIQWWVRHLGERLPSSTWTGRRFDLLICNSVVIIDELASLSDSRCKCYGPQPYIWCNNVRRKVSHEHGDNRVQHGGSWHLHQSLDCYVQGH